MGGPLPAAFFGHQEEQRWLTVAILLAASSPAGCNRQEPPSAQANQSGQRFRRYCRTQPGRSHPRAKPNSTTEIERTEARGRLVRVARTTRARP